ncbi:hypothetical protein [Paenibacillus antibioticophila]|uniref:hypothetical protein n=1 Tax=Paenibacillus antibioticophila TaxID=1274374 RepID=UPI001BB34548|nr:hypothetical protein [Paenibacillus antibioticophila]
MRKIMRTNDHCHAAKHRALRAALGARFMHVTHAYLVGIFQNLLELPCCGLVEMEVSPNDDAVLPIYCLNTSA